MKRAAPAVLLLVVTLGCGKGGTSPLAPGGDASVQEDALVVKDVNTVETTSESGLDALDTGTLDATDGGGSAVPEWKEMAGDVAGCKVQSLVNADKVRVFQWVPCDGIAGCERAQYDSHVVTASMGLGLRSSVGITQGAVVAGIVMGPAAWPSSQVILTDDDGWARVGFRPDPAATDCSTGAPGIGSTRYGVSICRLDEAKQQANCGGVLASPGVPAVLFSLPPNLVGAPGALPMGDQRWVWNWALPGFLSSVSNQDGSGYKVFLSANAYGSVREIGDVTTDGKSFFFSQDFAPEGGPERWNIAVSDGLSDPKPYLDLQDGSWLQLPSYAHSHIAWMRGINGTNEGSFDLVELWASPYNPDPSQLQPLKLCDWPDKIIPHLSRSSGYGYFALGAGTTAGSYREVIWDLAAKQSREIPIPDPFNWGWGMGMTKTHVWVMGRNPKGNTSALFRFGLK